MEERNTHEITRTVYLDDCVKIICELRYFHSFTKNRTAVALGL